MWEEGRRVFLVFLKLGFVKLHVLADLVPPSVIWQPGDLGGYGKKSQSTLVIGVILRSRPTRGLRPPLGFVGDN